MLQEIDLVAFRLLRKIPNAICEIKMKGAKQKHQMGSLLLLMRSQGKHLFPERNDQYLTGGKVNKR